MWSTVIATAVAATVGMSLVNVAYEMSRVRDAQALADNVGHDRSLQSQPVPGIKIDQQKTSDPGV